MSKITEKKYLTIEKLEEIEINNNEMIKELKGTNYDRMLELVDKVDPKKKIKPTKSYYFRNYSNNFITLLGYRSLLIPPYKEKHKKIMKNLIDIGCNLNHQGLGAETILTRLIKYYDNFIFPNFDRSTLINNLYEGVEFLLENKANPNIRDNDKQSAFHYACIRENKTLPKLILEKSKIKVNVNAKIHNLFYNINDSTYSNCPFTFYLLRDNIDYEMCNLFVNKYNYDISFFTRTYHIQYDKDSSIESNFLVSYLADFYTGYGKDSNYKISDKIQVLSYLLKLLISKKKFEFLFCFEKMYFTDEKTKQKQLTKEKYFLDECIKIKVEPVLILIRNLYLTFFNKKTNKKDIFEKTLGSYDKNLINIIVTYIC